ncbi:MAG: cytochrome c nitrite reductase small subunit [Weeksellaceae bacterium]|nr:cytochrome c nitrite reductase small subunit [Weeksellaceae bacterium]
MRKYFRNEYLRNRFRFWPSKKWEVPAVIVFAAFIGLGFYTLHLSKATSYLSDDPQACINCHVMTPHYMTWNKSSHREVAHCNDCHVPQDNFVRKYAFKAKDGFWHSYVFTTRTEPQVIRTKGAAPQVIRDNCVRCHEDQVTDARLDGFVATHHADRTDRLCWDCHKEVPHGRVSSLAAVGHQIEPLRNYEQEDEDIIPTWLRNVMEEENTQQTKKSTEK